MCIISATGLIAEMAVIWTWLESFDAVFASYFSKYKQMALLVAWSGIEC